MVKDKTVKNNLSVIEESKFEITPEQTDYRNYFDEICPYNITAPMKHTYRVELVKSVFNPKAFEVFKKYEASIHKKDGKSRKDYEGFLC